MTGSRRFWLHEKDKKATGLDIKMQVKAKNIYLRDASPEE